MKNIPVLILALQAICFSASQAQEFELETSAGGVTVKLNGELFTKYVTDQANKPYFYPIIGPTGASMTRAYPMEDVPGEKQDHPHHRGVNFGHHKVNGYNTWLERLTHAKRLEGKSPEEAEEILSTMGTTIHREYKSLKVATDHAVIVVANDYVDSKGNRMMTDERTYTFRAPDKDTRIIDVDITLSAPPHGVTHLADEKDAGLSIRVPHSISVDADRGGLLINSKGDTNIDTWGKRANWCDYSGKVNGETMGVAFMNHPSSFRYPTPWHARTYGLLTANPFGTKSVGGEKDGTIVLKGDDTITLKHRLLFHKGDHKQAKVDAAWKTYAAE